jgi:deoxyribonuclease-4
MSTSGGVWKALERSRAVGGEVCQIFVKNNMQWFGRPFLPPDLLHFRNHEARAGLKCVFGHTGYLINLAAPPSENREKSIKSLIQEVQLATDIELPFLVLHPGAHLGTGEETGINRIAEGLNEVFRTTKSSPVRIALENTAGQGSCLGCKLQHLAAIYDRVDAPKRLGICLDTAHLFASGYDIRSPKGWDSVIEELEHLLGCDQILAFHLNDSKTALGSRVDRHAHIGEGHIGSEAFRHIVNDERFREHPGCLETPKSDDLHEDRKNLNLLRSLVAVAAALKPSQGRRRRSAAKAGRKRASLG